MGFSFGRARAVVAEKADADGGAADTVNGAAELEENKLAVENEGISWALKAQHQSQKSSFEPSSESLSLRHDS